MIELWGTRMRARMRATIRGATIGVGTLLALVAGMSRAAEARVLRVPERFGTIQAAVDAAAAGDVVEVAPGSYCGATVDKALTLLGRGRATIVGCADGPV